MNGSQTFEAGASEIQNLKSNIFSGMSITVSIYSKRNVFSHISSFSTLVLTSPQHIISHSSLSSSGIKYDTFIFSFIVIYISSILTPSLFHFFSLSLSLSFYIVFIYLFFSISLLTCVLFIHIGIWKEK